MISNSDDRPDLIWVKGVDGRGMATVRLRRSIVRSDRRNAEDKVIGDSYAYEETETSLVDRPKLELYIEANFDALFAAGQAREGVEVLSDRDVLAKLRVDVEQLKAKKVSIAEVR